MLEVIFAVLLGSVNSFHIGNSLMNDGLGNFTNGNAKTGTYGLEAIARGYGHNDYFMSMHIDTSQAMHSIWENPNGAGGQVEVYRTTYGYYTNALMNYHWDNVLLEPYQAQYPSFGLDKESTGNFINLTRQNPANHNTVFYIYQVWPRQSSYENHSLSYSDYWLSEYPVDDEMANRPTRQYYDVLMDWAQQTYSPQGIVVREIPVGEVWHRINLAIEQGLITEFTMDDMHRDDLHASGDLGRYVAAATNFATMFQTDITGLVPPTAYFGTSNPQSVFDKLNKIIWEVVTGDSHSGIADFNDDGYVSAADRLIWQNAYGISAAGDTDGDGDTDGRDFLNWQRNYGGEPSPPLTGAVVTVPEPNCLVFLAAFSAFMFLLSRSTRADFSEIRA